jgi:hypothetical protein
MNFTSDSSQGLSRYRAALGSNIPRRQKIFAKIITHELLDRRIKVVYSFGLYKDYEAHVRKPAVESERCT